MRTTRGQNRLTNLAIIHTDNYIKIDTDFVLTTFKRNVDLCNYKYIELI